MKHNDRRIPKEIRTGKRPSDASRFHQPTAIEAEMIRRARCSNFPQAENDGPDGAGAQGIDLTDCAALIDGAGDDGSA